ncbi:hypothetical protein U1Q18_013244 [Sarracenia purpurea var. burkii]
MEGDDGLRKVECLRGRLLAERLASRVAKADAEQIGNKLTELENQLRAEIKSRNRAEKRLKFVLKKLESMNISCVSEDSEHSRSLEKTDVSPVSSTGSSGTKKPEDGAAEALTTKFAKCDMIEESLQKTKRPMISRDLEEDNVSSNQSHYSPKEESSSSSSPENAGSEDPRQIEESSRSHGNSNTDDFSICPSLKSCVEKEDSYEGNSDQILDDCVDDSLALVPVDFPKESQRADPIIVNASVEEVLDALRRAREKIQWSMERRHMVQVGSK